MIWAGVALFGAAILTSLSSSRPAQSLTLDLVSFQGVSSLDRLPKREQKEAKELLRAVVYAPSEAGAVEAREAFRKRYKPWYPKAVETLEDDWDRMVTFFRFPESHWKHLRTTNVVESPFASVRLRTGAAKRYKRVEHATALIWKLLAVAERRFRRLDAPHQLKDVLEGRKFEDGKPVSDRQRKEAA